MGTGRPHTERGQRGERPLGAVPTLAVEFSPDGRTLAVARADEDGKQLRFRLVDGRTGRLLAEPPPLPCRVPSEAAVYGECDALLAFDSSGGELAYGVANYTSPTAATELSLYDIPRRRVTGTLGSGEVGPEPLTGISFGTGDRTLLLSSLPGAMSEATRIWDLRRRTVVGTLPGSVGAVTSHPDGDLLVTERGQAYRMPRAPGCRPSEAPASPQPWRSARTVIIWPSVTAPAGSSSGTGD